MSKQPTALPEPVYQMPGLLHRIGMVAYYFYIKDSSCLRGESLYWVFLPKGEPFTLWEYVSSRHVVRVPLNSWDKPTVLVAGGHESAAWTTKVGIYGFDVHPAKLWLKLKDTWGSEVQVEIDLALSLMNTGGIFLSGIMSNLVGDAFWHQEYRNRYDKIKLVTAEAVQRIAATRNFVRSTQGREIKEWLEKELQTYL